MSASIRLTSLPDHIGSSGTEFMLDWYFFKEDVLKPGLRGTFSFQQNQMDLKVLVLCLQHLMDYST